MFEKIWDWPESPIRAHRRCRSLVHSCFSFQVICVIKGQQVGDHERRPHTAAVVPAGSGQPQIGGGGRQKVAVPPARARCESTGLFVICVSVCRGNDSDWPPQGRLDCTHLAVQVNGAKEDTSHTIKLLLGALL